MLRTEWEKRRRPAETAPSSTPSIQLAPGETPAVIMYATKTCPVCIKARRWLVEAKIPFVEKDVGSDQAAAMELANKGRAQGVSTSGVPVFDIRGRLLPGFDKEAIKKLLAGASPAPSQGVPTPPPAAQDEPPSSPSDPPASPPQGADPVVPPIGKGQGMVI